MTTDELSRRDDFAAKVSVLAVLSLEDAKINVPLKNPEFGVKPASNASTAAQSPPMPTMKPPSSIGSNKPKPADKPAVQLLGSGATQITQELIAKVASKDIHARNEALDSLYGLS